MVRARGGGQDGGQCETRVGPSVSSQLPRCECGLDLRDLGRHSLAVDSDAEGKEAPCVGTCRAGAMLCVALEHRYW
jgi:hypothetical protein